ncbi:MAG: EamA/RhaT family transporter [Bacteroidia bacterium]
MSAWLLLGLSIACSCAINLIFKALPKFSIDRFPAIVVNYLVCFSVGFIQDGHYDAGQYVHSNWFPWLILLGCFFVLIFFFMATTTVKLGVSVNAVSSKMAMIIPIILAIWWFKEQTTPLFFIGVALALTSIYLISIRHELKLNRHYIWYPIIVFLGSGAIDFSLKLIEYHLSEKVAASQLSMTIFLGAFAMGLAVSIYRLGTSRFSWSYTNILAGIALGIPNYFSIYFLIRSLASFKEQSAMVFGINNVAVVLFSTLLSVIIFKEHLSRKNQIGLALAAIAILIIAYVQG